MNSKLAFTIPETVAASGLGRSTIYELFKSGALKPRKSGRRTLVLLPALEDYLKSLPMANHREKNMKNRPACSDANRFENDAASQKATPLTHTPKLIWWQFDRHLMVTRLEVRLG